MDSVEELEQPLENQNIEEVVAVQEEEQASSWDYEGWEKEQLLEELKTIKSQFAIKTSKAQLGDLKKAFEVIFREAKKIAFDKFIEDGGEKDGFDYRDETSDNFYNLYKDLITERKKHQQNQEEQKVLNEKKKNALVNELRELVSGTEDQETYKRIKEIQTEWKETGAVSQSSYRELNASYYALLDRYYNNRGIYNDLKKLDREKNKKKKIEIIESVEALIGSENSLEAVKQLNELHGAYKDSGPVEEADSEDLWQRLKAATDKIREERDAQIEIYKTQLDANLVLKQGLLEKILPYKEKDSDKIEEWKALTEEVLALKDEWQKVGPISRDSNSNVSDEFWTTFRTFFATKNAFFGKLDEKRNDNLAEKEGLCEKVEALQDSEDFRDTAETIKKIQGEWKKIGPAPRAQNEEIYKRFRKACDHFFDRRKADFGKKDEEYKGNLSLKNEVIEKITALTEKDSVESFEKLTEEFFAIGFVPRDKVKTIQNKFKAAADQFIDNLKDIDTNELETLKLNIELGAVKGTANEKDVIYKKSTAIRKKISSLNQDIATLNTNVEFFAHSKDIDNIRKDVENKVGIIQKEVDQLKAQLKILNSSN